MVALKLWFHQALHDSHHEREQQRWAKLERRFEAMRSSGPKRRAAKPRARRRTVSGS